MRDELLLAAGEILGAEPADFGSAMELAKFGLISTFLLFLFMQINIFETNLLFV